MTEGMAIYCNKCRRKTTAIDLKQYVSARHNRRKDKPVEQSLNIIHGRCSVCGGWVSVVGRLSTQSEVTYADGDSSE